MKKRRIKRKDEKANKDGKINVEPMVDSRDLSAVVKLAWGQNLGRLSVKEAQQHAFNILEASALAEISACVMQWACTRLQLSPQEALVFVGHISQTEIPSCTINLGDEHIRPETARQRATTLMNVAFGVEMEARLASFLLQSLDRSPEQVDHLIQEFREMRGAITIWPNQEGE